VNTRQGPDLTGTGPAATPGWWAEPARPPAVAGWPDWSLSLREPPSPGARFDPSVPHPARVYDYWLGGKDHFPADRQVGEQVIRQRPQVAAGARANRAFLARVVRYLAAERGIGQFLDIGTGTCASYCVPFRRLRRWAWRRVGGRLVRFRVGRGWPSGGWCCGGLAGALRLSS
jgi:hypothetical protein